MCVWLAVAWWVPPLGMDTGYLDEMGVAPPPWFIGMLGTLLLIQGLVDRRPGSTRARDAGLTVFGLVCALQGYGVAMWFESLFEGVQYGLGGDYDDFAPDPGVAFRLTLAAQWLAMGAMAWVIARALDRSCVRRGAWFLTMASLSVSLLTESFEVGSAPELGRALLPLLATPVWLVVAAVFLARRALQDGDPEKTSIWRPRSGWDALMLFISTAASGAWFGGFGISETEGTYAGFALVTQLAAFASFGWWWFAHATTVRPWTWTGSAAWALVVALVMACWLGLRLATTDAWTSAFPPGAFEGSQEYTLTLDARDAFAAEDASRLVAYIRAGGADAELESQSPRTIAVRVEDAISSSSLLQALESVEFGLYAEHAGPAAAEMAWMQDALGNVRGTCDEVEAAALRHPRPECDYTILTDENGCTLRCFEREPVIRNADVAYSEVDRSGYNGQPQVTVVLEPEAARRFEDTTALLADRRGTLGIFIDGECVSAPVVLAPIGGGRLAITPPLDRSSAEETAALAGALQPGPGIAPWTARD